MTNEIQAAIPLLAALLAAGYPFFILYAATLMTETFFIAALLWSLERALVVEQQLRQDGHMRWQDALFLGVALGVATLFRQSILPWVLVLFTWLAIVSFKHLQAVHGKQFNHFVSGTLLPLAVTGIILVIFIMPFTIRNYRVYGEFLLLNSNAGYAMYSAQHPMHGTSFREFDAAPVPPDLMAQGLNEVQLDKILMAQGLQFMRDEPGRYLLLSLSRVRDYFEFWPTPGTTLLHNLGRMGSFGLLLPFILIGLWMDIRGKTQATSYHSLWGAINAVLFSNTGMLYLFVSFYSLLHILTWAMPRYRLPVDAVLMPFAALALIDLAGRTRLKQFGFLRALTKPTAS